MAEEVIVIDYQMGNLRSVLHALKTVGARPKLSRDPKELLGASKLVLPGQGELANAITEIDSLGMREAIIRRVNDGVPLLGICVGLQLLFDAGEEAPGQKCLGLVSGTVPRFPNGMNDPVAGTRLKIPQMGWNSVRIVNPNALTAGMEDDTFFYFVHSYYCKPSDAYRIGLETSYGDVSYCSMAADEENGRNLYATQFHPEKSQRTGLRMLSRFVEI